MSTTMILELDVQQQRAILGSEAPDEVTDVPITTSVQQGIKHAVGLITNVKQDGGGSLRFFEVLPTNSSRLACKY